MSELHKIIGRCNDLNRDNGPNIIGSLYGSRVSTLRADIRKFKYENEGYEDLALIQPEQCVRKFKLRGLGI